MCTVIVDCAENAECTEDNGTLIYMCSNGYGGDGINSCASK